MVPWSRTMKERAAGIHQIETGQPVLHRHLLRPQMFLHRQRVVSAAFDRGIVDDHHTVAAGDTPDARENTGGGYRIVIDPLGSQWRQLEERHVGIQQPTDTLARQKLASLYVPLTRFVSAALGRQSGAGVQIVDKHLHRFGIAGKPFAACVGDTW
jgi:hypothetical protein